MPASPPRRRCRPGRETTRMRRIFGNVILYLVGIAVLGGAGWGAYRMWQDKEIALSASRSALADVVAKGPVVQVATIIEGPKERQIQLLADTRPFQSATLYGKVSGYVSAMNVDRGDRVT